MIKQMNRRNFTFCIDTDDLAKVNEIAVKENKTVAEVLRTLIKKALEEGQK